MAERAYLDWNATAPIREEAKEAITPPSRLPVTILGPRRRPRRPRQIEDAREEVATLVGAESRNITFTSSATEANALALTPAIEIDGRREARDQLFVSATEHPSVLSGGRFNAGEVEELPVTTDGVVDLDALRLALSRSERPLVSVMLANNESGVVQPIAETAAIVHAAGGLLHVDAVQGPGRIACDIGALGADLMSISSHKLGGPQGAGALIRRGDVHFADPLISGGGQERGLRAGTENVAAIAGFGAAAAAQRAVGGCSAHAALRDRFEAGLKSSTPQAVIFGENAARLPNTTLFALPGTEGRNRRDRLRPRGIAVSSGSACSSGKVQPSHVLAAMGVSTRADAGRRARQPWLEHHRSRRSSAFYCLEKACFIITLTEHANAA